MQEKLADDIINIYERHAEAFTQKRSTALFEKGWLDRFLAHVPPKEKILDIGCGNGTPIADYFIQQGVSVTGIDTSAPLLDMCRKRFPDHQWLQVDMRLIDLDETFDGIIAWDSFFHLTRQDQRRMFAIFRKHAHDDTVLMFTSGTSDGEAIGTMEGDALYHASLSPDEYRQTLYDHGYSVIQHMVQDADCGGRTVWLAKATAG